MKLTTNIVLIGEKGSTSPYMVKLFRNEELSKGYHYKREDDEPYPGKHASLVQSGIERWTRKTNEWYLDSGGTFIPSFPTSTVRLYFPQYSVDTYSPRCTYALTFSTYVHGVEIELGSYIFKRGDSLACRPTKFNGMDDYYEYMDFEIADPFYLIYSQEETATDIRQMLGEPEDVNDNGSLLYISLNVVENCEDHYIMKDGWTGGQNGLLISDPVDLKLELTYNNDRKSIHLQLKYNPEFADFNEYISKTYNCECASINWEYVIMDDNDIYYHESKLFEIDGDFTDDYSFDFLSNYDSDVDEDGDGDFDNGYSPSFLKDHDAEEYDKINIKVKSNNPIFNSWDNWKPGLFIQASASIESFFADVDMPNEQSYPFMTVFSNKIPLTQEMFAMIVCPSGYESFPTTIDLSDISMNNIDITAINKIEQKVTVVTPTNTAKNNMTQPVFYQTRDLNRTIIHSAVTENISINLDAYKSRVKSFMLMLEGITFPEIGRTNNGVVFKVVGKMLPKAVSNGILYILDQDRNLVTTGKFVYIS